LKAKIQNENHFIFHFEKTFPVKEFSQSTKLKKGFQEPCGQGICKPGKGS